MVSIGLRARSPPRKRTSVSNSTPETLAVPVSKGVFVALVCVEKWDMVVFVWDWAIRNGERRGERRMRGE